MTSASSNSASENVFIVPVVVPELELSDVERKIFGANLVERADHAALHQRPEAFDRVGVDHADHVLIGRMANRAVLIVFALMQIPVCLVIVAGDMGSGLLR